jgi:large subunit ribosomal protein L24
MTRLKKGDQVIVVAGADKGTTGRILKMDRKHGRVLVEGVNMKFKHVRRSQEQPQGGRVQREYPLDVSNVAYLDAESGKGVRLGAVVEGGRKHRVMRPSGRKVD